MNPNQNTVPEAPAGYSWHRNDWTQEMLPQGWRPLLSGEKSALHDDEHLFDIPTKDWRKVSEYCGSLYGARQDTDHTRTRRPIPPAPWEQAQPSAGSETTNDFRKSFTTTREQREIFRGVFAEWLTTDGNDFDGLIFCLLREIALPATDKSARLEASIDALSRRCGFPIVEDREQVLATIGNKVERLRAEEYHCNELAKALDAYEEQVLALEAVAKGAEGLRAALEKLLTSAPIRAVERTCPFGGATDLAFGKVREALAALAATNATEKGQDAL